MYIKQLLLTFFALLCFSCKSTKSSSEESEVLRIDINSRYFGNLSSLLCHTNDSVFWSFDSCLISFFNNNKPYITPAEKPSIKIFCAKYSSVKHNILMHKSNTIDSLSTFSQNTSASESTKHTSFNKSLLIENLCIVVCCFVIVLCIVSIYKRSK